MTYEVNTPEGPAVASKYGNILLSDLMSCDLQEGSLRWMVRSVDKYPEIRNVAIWNKRFGGLPALNNYMLGYRGGTVLSRPQFAHRVIFAMANGWWPSGQIDHINGIRHDNRAINLRDVSRSENMKNAASRKNTSGVMGVYWDSGRSKWAAHIAAPGVKRSLGRFDNIEDAIIARKMAEIQYGFHENHGRKPTEKLDPHPQPMPCYPCDHRLPD